MAKPDSWMPVYWADLWNKTRDLTAVEQCAYYNLLGSMWVDGGSLPNDNDRLQRMSRVTEKEWRTVSETVTAFFTVREDGRLTQRRLGEEYAKAMKAYTARSEHIATVNSNRKQSPPTVTATGTVHTTHNSQSPNGEKHPSDVLAKPRKRKSQISPEWMPSTKDVAHATNRKLDTGTISSIAETFRDHHLAKQTLSADFSANWRTWVANHIGFHGTGPWPRPDAGRPNGHRSGPASVFAALRENLSEGNLGGQGDAGDGLGRGVGDYRTDASDPTAGFIDGNSYRGIDPETDAERGDSEGPSSSPIADESETGIDRGHTAEPCDLRRGNGAIPSGRSETHSQNTAVNEYVVAGLGRTQGQIGTSHAETAQAIGSDDYGIIPEFLKRSA